MRTFEKSITFCSDLIDEFGCKLVSIINKFTEIEDKLKVYELRYNKFEKELNILKTTINNSE